MSDNIKEREAAGKKKKALDALLKICQLKRFESQQLACQANKSTMTEALDKATTEKKRLDEEGINRQAMQQELSKKLRKLQVCSLPTFLLDIIGRCYYMSTWPR